MPAPEMSLSIVRKFVGLAVLLAGAAVGATAGSGNYLVITAEEYAGSAPLIQFADAKAAMGFNVSTYVAANGTSRSTIKTYIENWYNPSVNCYVLIVGDTDGTSSATTEAIPHWVGSGSQNATTDLPYACMDAGDDWYPEIFIGRFSVRSVSMLQDVVDKTLLVESGNYSDPTYTKRAAFLATDDSTAQAEQNHDWVIDNYMTPAEFDSIKIYAGQGGGTADVTAAVNQGCLFTVYFGHSSSSGWWSPSFGTSNVQALSNDGLYGLAMGWSCNTSRYSSDECVGETWLREAHKGAAAYLSASDYVWWGSVSAWDSSRRMERYFFESFFVDGIWEVGPAWQAALWRILADPDYGPTHDHTRNIFEEFVLLGDPALKLPGGCPEAGELTLNHQMYACEDLAGIIVADCGLDLNPGAIDTVEITVDSTSEPTGETVLLTETGPNTAEFAGTLALSETNAPGVLLVADRDAVTATYIDEDNGQGQQITVTDIASVDCVAPLISNVRTAGIGSTSATIAFDADEPVASTVFYGLSCDALIYEASSGTYDTTPSVLLDELASLTRYYYAVQAEDEPGNTTYDDSGGACYTFFTAGGPVLIYDFPLDMDPGWSTLGEWAFGHPTGQGGTAHGHPDPTAGATGANVYGVNLNGDYSLTPGGPYYLTAGPLDLTNIVEVQLTFQRWLNTDYQPYVDAMVDVSNNGSHWVRLWENPGGNDITENSWSLQEYDISAVADNQGTVYIRWGYEVASDAWAYSGWNIDDIEIWGVVPHGDLDADGDIDYYDFGILSDCLDGPEVPFGTGCGGSDLDGDGDVDLRDFALLQEASTG
ncbi:MAG: hypothetical protein KAY37_03855 [Phycisphaerae bacterium]|nr:hypothetical protein [Phycisphaerae bacterium]